MTSRETTTRSLADVARHAREVAATGEQVQLWIAGVHAHGLDRAGLRIFDRGGVPHIVCRDTHPVASAIGRRARL